MSNPNNYEYNKYNLFSRYITHFNDEKLIITFISLKSIINIIEESKNTLSNIDYSNDIEFESLKYKIIDYLHTIKSMGLLLEEDVLEISNELEMKNYSEFINYADKIINKFSDYVSICFKNIIKKCSI